MRSPTRLMFVIAIASALTGTLLASDTQATTSRPPEQAIQLTQVTGFVSITRLRVTTQGSDKNRTADVTGHITLEHVPNTPFTYEATLVDADGNPHTDIRGRTYTASREVSTGDEQDTDRYTVTIPLAGLFTSRAPELYVRARLLDSSGNVVATAPLLRFPG